MTYDVRCTTSMMYDVQYTMGTMDTMYDIQQYNMAMHAE